MTSEYYNPFCTEHAVHHGPTASRLLPCVAKFAPTPQVDEGQQRTIRQLPPKPLPWAELAFQAYRNDAATRTLLFHYSVQDDEGAEVGSTHSIAIVPYHNEVDQCHANLIIEAVNAYPAVKGLVEALRDADSLLVDCDAAMTDCAKAQEEVLDDIPKIREKIRAALATATRLEGK